MLNIIGKLNNSDLLTNSILFWFDIVNMFPCIDNESELNSVNDMSKQHDNKFPPVTSAFQTLEVYSF